MIAAKQYDAPQHAGSYNVGPDDCDCVTTGYLVGLFCRYWGGGMDWVSRPDGGPHEANYLKLDCSRLKNTFGWGPVWHVEEAVRNTVEWSKAFLGGGDVAACMDGQINKFLTDK